MYIITTGWMEMWQTSETLEGAYLIRRDHLRTEMDRLITHEDGSSPSGRVDQDELDALIKETRVHTYDVVSCPMEEGDMQFLSDRVLVAQIAAEKHLADSRMASVLADRKFVFPTSCSPTRNKH